MSIKIILKFEKLIFVSHLFETFSFFLLLDGGEGMMGLCITFPSFIPLFWSTATDEWLCMHSQGILYINFISDLGQSSKEYVDIVIPLDEK